jgi:hypothetical protein
MRYLLIALLLCSLGLAAQAQLVVYRTVDKGIFNAEDGAVEANRSDKGYLIVDLAHNLVTRVYYWGKGTERYYSVIADSPLGKRTATQADKTIMYFANLHQEDTGELEWADSDLLYGQVGVVLKEPLIEAPKSLKGVRIELGGPAGNLEEDVSEVGYLQVTASLDSKLTKLANTTPWTLDDTLQYILTELLDDYQPEPHEDD